MSAPTTATSREDDNGVSLLCRGLTLSTLAFLVVVSARAKHWVHPDCAMYLQSAELLLEGQVPYVDFVEINPPLIMYLSAIPVLVARWTGAGIVQVFNVMLALFAGFGAWMLVRHLPRIAPDLDEPHRHVVANLWLGLSFLILIGGHWAFPTIAVGTDYGQREHLVVLGYLPFLLLRVVAWRGSRSPSARSGSSSTERFVAGVVAGLVLCLKPHFIVAAVLVELYLFLETKWVRPLFRAEVYAAFAVGVLYAAHFLFVPAAMRSAFFDRWLPLATSRYQAYDWPYSHVLSLETIHVAAALVLLLWLPWRAPYRAMARRVMPFGIFALGSAGVLIQQHKGWPYHLIPITAGIWLTVSLLLVQVMQVQVRAAGEPATRLERVQGGVVRVRPPLLLVLIGLWFASVVQHSPHMFARNPSKTLALVRRVTDPSDAVMYVTTAVQTMYPEAFLSRRRPGSRFLWTFPIAYLFEGRGPVAPGESAYQAPAGRESEQEKLLTELADDVATKRPKLIFVWAGPSSQGCPPGFVVANYLHHHQFSRRALADYFQAQRVGFWEVWARRGTPLRAHGQERAPR